MWVRQILQGRNEQMCNYLVFGRYSTVYEKPRPTIEGYMNDVDGTWFASLFLVLNV